MTSFQVIYAPMAASASVPLWKSVLEDMPSVFTAPALLSDELCAFFEMPVGSSISRTDIAKRLFAYAKAHGLMEGQKIKKDDAITALFHLAPEDSLYALNLQKYLAPHIKAVAKGPTNEEIFRTWWVEQGSPSVIVVDANERPSWQLERLYKLLSAFPITECAIYNANPPVEEDEECDYCDGECECGGDEEDEKPVASCGCSKIYHAVCSKHV